MHGVCAADRKREEGSPLHRITRGLLAGRKGFLEISLIATFFHLSVIAMAVEPHGALAIGPDLQVDKPADRPTLSVPVGRAQCPASGTGASCSTAPVSVT